MMITALALSMMTQEGQSMRLMRTPDIFGDQVVFTYATDLWIADRKGGNARRLTSTPGNDVNAKFSPDGKWIAFTSGMEGNPEVYVISSDGGEPKRLTFEPDVDLVLDWTPDGNIAYASGQNTPGAFTLGLRIISPKGGFPAETKLSEVYDLSFSPNGKQVAYDRNNSHGFNWRRYRGGTQGVITFSDVNATTSSEIPHGRENRWNPMWVGDKIYYICDKTLGTRNLWSFDTITKTETQLTRFSDADIKWPGTDGKTIVFERNGFLLTFDLATKAVTTLNPTINTEAYSARPRLRNFGAEIRNFSLSPSGARIAVEARGEIFSVPAKAGDTRDLTGGTSGVKEYSPAWSPDGKTIAYLTDRSGEVKICSVPQMGGTEKVIATDPTQRLTAFRWSPTGKLISYETAENDLFVLNPDSGKAELVFRATQGAPSNYDWSADGKWIAYISIASNLFGSVNLYNVEEKKSYKITDGYYRDDAISFDLSGKYLYLISARTFNPVAGDFDLVMQMENSQRVYVLPLSKDLPNPLRSKVDEEPTGEEKQTAEKPVVVDVVGLADRALPLPLPPGNYQAVIGQDNGVFILSNGTLKSFDFGSKQTQDIISGFQNLDFNTKRNKIAYYAAGNLGITDVRPGIEVGQGKVNTTQVEFMWDPRAEWKQIFWEAWRWERDRYYDADMLGLDWNAIGKQYAAYLPYVNTRADLSYVLGLMLSELGTGHAYVAGGDQGIVGGAPPAPVGALGADFEIANGHVRFKKVYKGLNFETERRGPLGEPGVEVNSGDYLLAIDGKTLDGSMSPHELLLGKAERYVNLLVNSVPSTTGARTVRVRTIADESNLRYIDWVEANRKKVGELSGGKIGYLHVPNTSEQGMIEFIKGYYSQSDKDALIVDERFNGGGNIPTFFIEKLQRQVLTAFRQRNGGDVSFPTQAFQGPMCMLINQYAGSGGDMFPWLFRASNLGPLIGMRTWGGLVGITGNAPLIDGGGVTAPEFGIFDVRTGTWIAENKGIDPDIQVDIRPDVLASGHDAQLEKAVEHLLGEMKKGKKPYKRPAFPRVGGGS